MFQCQNISKWHYFLIYIDISQRLLDILLPFTEGALNEATMKEYAYSFFLFSPRLDLLGRCCCCC